MKALVTGATGFIGNYVIEELLRRKIDVVASATSADKAVSKRWYNDVVFVPHTIGKENAGEDLFEKFHSPDIMIHLAWQGLPNYKQLFHFEEVLPAQYAFIKTLIAGGLKDVTVTGTCFEYGMQEGMLSEEMVPKPDNPYALAKNTLRCFLEEYKKKDPFHFKWIRLFYMYGEGQSPLSLLSLLDAAIERGESSFNMSPGDQLRDYLPVEKMAENIVNVSLQNDITGVINSASGNPISVKALVEKHLEKQHKKINLNLGHYPYADHEPRDLWGDITVLKKIDHV